MYMSSSITSCHLWPPTNVQTKEVHSTHLWEFKAYRTNRVVAIDINKKYIHKYKNNFN